nr:hypothetical protein [Kibdelosporangium sp. MJ126-NF4]
MIAEQGMPPRTASRRRLEGRKICCQRHRLRLSRDGDQGIEDGDRPRGGVKRTGRRHGAALPGRAAVRIDDQFRV